MLMTVREMPRTGSLQESVLLLTILKKEEVEAAKTRAIIQTMLKQDAGPEAWQDFFKLAFPWVAVAKKRDEAETIAALLDEVKRGPLAVYAQQDKTFRSRLKTKVIERRETTELASRISSKLPAAIPK